jgi:hypothetical protein
MPEELGAKVKGIPAASSRPRIEPPERVVGGLTVYGESLFHDDRLCVRIDRVEMMPNGVLLQLELHLAQQLPYDYHLSGRFPWTVFQSEADPAKQALEAHSVPPENVFRFGVLYEDGRSVATGTVAEFEGQQEKLRSSDVGPDRPVLLYGPAGGMGGGLRASTSLWLWPDPPKGEGLEFVAEWPTLQIPEVRAAVSGQVLDDGRTRIVELWPPLHP